MWWKCLLCGIGGLIIGGIIMQEMDRKALEEAYAAIKEGEASMDKIYTESMEIFCPLKSLPKKTRS